jgi:hypothetical protein
MFINLSFDASVSTTARAVVNSVAQFLQDQFSDPITININVAFGNIGGLGSSSYNLANQTYSYSQIKTALSNDATSSDDVSAISSLLATDPISGTHSWNMTPAEAKALGLIAGNGTASDGSMTFSNTAAFDYDRSNGIGSGQYDFYGVVAHEMTEVMGRELNATGNNVATGAGYHPLDLFKYASATNHSFTGTQFGYFSVNNGFIDLNPNFNTNPNGDFGDWAASEAADSFLAFSNSSVVNAITTADLAVMDAIGFTRTDDYISTTATSGQVAVGSSITGNVNYARDHDWIRVQLTAGVQYTIDEQGQSVGAGTLSDPLMALRSGTGQLITSDDDSGGGSNARIVYTPTATGAYYIDAGAFDDEGTGTYRVSISGGPVSGSVAINDVSITEGNSGTKIETFTVTRSGGTAAFAVNYFTSDGGATVADNDYAANSGTLQFGSGVNTQTISVTINGDTKFESDEAFFVNLSGATNGATISDNLGIGTITNDDAAPAGSISINDVTISEGNSGTKVAAFTVTRSGGTAAFAVNYFTSDGGATVADNDYAANSGTLNFGAGVNTQTISVTINGDTKFESDEAFFVNLSGATNGATINDNLGIGTITNDDAAPAGSVSINDVTISEGNSGTKVATFTVTRSGGTTAFAVNYLTSDGGATTADSDYVANSGTLNFGAGVNTQTISVTINGDTKFESDEAFFVNLSGATNGASISDGQGIGTITNDDINHAPQISFPDGTNVPANPGQILAASSLFSATDADGDTLTYFFQDGTSSASSGHFVLNGAAIAQGAAFHVTGTAQLAQLTFVAGSADDDLSVQVADDKGALSAAAGFHVHVNRAPVLTVPASIVTANANQSLQASSLFSATDADGDTLTYFFQDGTSSASSGHFVLNGTAIAQGAAFHVTGTAQLAQLTFVAGSVDDDLSMQVGDDKGALSAAAGFHIHVNRAPVLTVPASTVTANANQSLQASSLFSATDADGDTLTYFFQDGTAAANSGHFVLNGTAIAQGAAFHVTGAAQLAQLSFVAGSVDDDLSMQLADDKGALSAGAAVHVHANHAPVLTVPASTVTTAANQSLQASSLFSATDADGDPLTYFFQDGTSAANSGHFVLNGTAIAQGAAFHVTGAAQLAQLTFVAGSVDDDLSMQLADDKGALSAGAAVHVHANQAPLLTIPSTNVAASSGHTFSASSLFSATDVDGDALSYYIYDATPDANSGHFVVNGTVVPASTIYTVTAAQFAQTTFVAGANGTSDLLFAMATDGQANSNNNVFTPFHVNVVAANQAPVLTVPSTNVAASSSQVFSASSLFSATDVDGDALSYYIYDATPDANSGHFAVNGTVVPASTIYTVTAAQFAQTTFVTGTSGTSDLLFAMATDGQINSNNNVFTAFHVNVTASSAGPVASSASGTVGDNFVFAQDTGQKAAGAADNHLSNVAPPADHFHQAFGAAIAASVYAGAGLGTPDAAIDPLVLFGLHATDHFVV